MSSRWRSRSAVDPATKRQIELLREIDRVLRRARIRYWLRGGWAIDFLGGRGSRAHADVDLVTWERHRARLWRLLVARGYRPGHPVRVAEAQANFVKRGEEVSVVFLRRGARDRIVTAGIPEWRWPARSLALPPLRLDGLTCRVVAPRQLLAEKLTHPRPLRAKDRASVRALRAILSARARVRPRGRAASRRATARRC